MPTDTPTTTAELVISQATSMEGAWRLEDDAAGGKADVTAVKIVQDGYFTVTVYDQQARKFIGTYGGTFSNINGRLTGKYEFNTFDSTLVGKSVSGTSALQNGKWRTTGLGRSGDVAETWVKIDEQRSSSPLAGTWRISGRERNGQMSTMQPGPRKTLKILSDSRFQWIAFNSETGEFSGTGGGTYTAQNGKYTENIEFFSRDQERVGMQLTFDYEAKDGKWHHSGKSSTGNKINEIWERISSK
ncbi:membrane or secreted protein [Pontibacter sp. SD6]|uniref:Membrane or secreted protein n=2 Tax=Pontibacter cellulosilyticus TaxID=1720253 RepID=A0A923N494_9BACT|nr:membrane or secreted protein [Pontibacter cellulosilyticus]